MRHRAARLKPGFAGGLLYGLTPARRRGKCMEIKQDVTIKTWDGTWTYHPKVLVTPESVEDLVEIMTDEVRFPSPVRPAGSMHSTARMNGDDGRHHGRHEGHEPHPALHRRHGDGRGRRHPYRARQCAEGARAPALHHHRDRQRHPGRDGDRRHQGLILPRRLRPGQLLCDRACGWSRPTASCARSPSATIPRRCRSSARATGCSASSTR